MNIYFLVEGRRTEMKIYPAWLSCLVPELTRVNHFDQVATNNYYIITGGGYPSILNTVLPNAVQEINVVGRYDYLAVCLDADESSVAEREAEVRAVFNRIALENAGLEIIVQNRCIETWLLGNRKIYSPNPQNADLIKWTRFYDVSANDPELMGVYPGYANHARFHESYLKALFAEKNMTYTKTRPRDAAEEHYFNQLMARVLEEPQHLQTFQRFLNFCKIVQANRKNAAPT